MGLVSTQYTTTAEVQTFSHCPEAESERKMWFSSHFSLCYKAAKENATQQL